MENEVSALILNPRLSHQKDHVKEQYLSRDPATKLWPESEEQEERRSLTKFSSSTS